MQPSVTQLFFTTAPLAVKCGTVKHSILFEGVTVKKGAVVEDSIVFPGTVIEEDAVVRNAVIGEKAVIGKGCYVGDEHTVDEKLKSKYCSGGISLIGGGVKLSPGKKIGIDAMVSRSI